MACGKRLWDRYRSESSVHASISVGEDSSNSVRALIASVVRERLCRRAIRRFATGFAEVSVSLDIAVDQYS